MDKIDDVKVDRRGVTKFLVYWVGYPRPKWKLFRKTWRIARSLLRTIMIGWETKFLHVVQSFLDKEG